MQHKLSNKVKRLNRDFAVKFGLSEKYTKFEKIILVVLR